MRLLCVVSDPKGEESLSFKVAEKFITNMKKKHKNIEVVIHNLYKEGVENLSLESISGKNSKMKDMAEHFAGFDFYVFCSPMWNLSIPSILKAYFDHILLKGVSFRYNKYGMPIGLLKKKRALCILSRGGVYSFWPMTVFAHDKKYLRHILSFIGIRNVKFLEIDGVDKYPTKKEKIVDVANKKAAKLVKCF